MRAGPGGRHGAAAAASHPASPSRPPDLPTLLTLPPRAASCPEGASGPCMPRPNWLFCAQTSASGLHRGWEGGTHGGDSGSRTSPAIQAGRRAGTSSWGLWLGVPTSRLWARGPPCCTVCAQSSLTTGVCAGQRTRAGHAALGAEAQDRLGAGGSSSSENQLGWGCQRPGLRESQEGWGLCLGLGPRTEARSARLGVHGWGPGAGTGRAGQPQGSTLHPRA